MIHKKTVEFTGIIGILLTISGVVFLTYSLVQTEQKEEYPDAVSADAQVVSIYEDLCTRGRWSNTCYDISILFTDTARNTISTMIEDEFDKPVTDVIPIIYSMENPQLAMWNLNIRRPWWDTMSGVSCPMIIVGIIVYAGSLFYIKKNYKNNL